ncbi:2-deoxy-D-gluconate 3-dehydrogenase [archaeon]|nr:2-deoxy-D-gluconate 3-dehydrogenase [archaeon]|tara:strand:- start:376 stop:1077 length:702 start_codon:yes stop_codon:yes gene_type:complete
MKNIFSVENKVVIVTGSAGGNGAAISRGLESHGAEVVKADLPFCDVTNTAHLDSLVEAALSHTGEINGLVNCAGITRVNDLFEYTEGDWNDTHQVNLKAPYELSRKVAKYMRVTGGSIINITSLNSELAFPNNPAYVSAKGGLKQLTKSLALDLGKYNIRVNNLGPGYIRTNMTKMSWNNRREEIEERTILGRWGIPEDLVGTVIFLLSSASSYVTGQDIYVDGGYLTKGMKC